MYSKLLPAEAGYFPATLGQCLTKLLSADRSGQDKHSRAIIVITLCGVAKPSKTPGENCSVDRSLKPKLASLARELVWCAALNCTTTAFPSSRRSSGLPTPSRPFNNLISPQRPPLLRAHRLATDGFLSAPTSLLPRLLHHSKPNFQFPTLSLLTLPAVFGIGAGWMGSVHLLAARRSYPACVIAVPTARPAPPRPARQPTMYLRFFA
ncbi:hypothetical protein LSTR_LSTR005322 [Laodelphax striatellus]|uniref:Uncharacterized protein n=1 Tax=Laodelphax striatellus TaxID=195883 RepID=A0A482X8Q0_LAOST|nr:hypothetical protein LSTR_LSTR005322 [Laodelphax striatellus]